MVKLTPEVIEDARQFVNPVRDRELNLRGFKIPAIENLGATNNQFDTVDFSDNDLKRLENFPLLPRMKCLLLSNNRISYIQSDIGHSLPSIHTLVLTNNNIQELGDVDPLVTLPKLEYLSLMGNPITHKPQYRLYMIYKVPQIRVLDYRRIKQVERDCARDNFVGEKGQALQNEVVKKTFTPSDIPEQSKVNGQAMPADDMRRIREAITSTQSLEEVENLQLLLQAGHIPGKQAEKQTQEVDSNSMEFEAEVEEEESMEG